MRQRCPPRSISDGWPSGSGLRPLQRRQVEPDHPLAATAAWPGSAVRRARPRPSTILRPPVRRDEEEGSSACPFSWSTFRAMALPSTGGKNRDRWSAFISEYVTGSENLCVLCLLVDLRHPGLAIDREAYELLASSGVPCRSSLGPRPIT